MTKLLILLVVSVVLAWFSEQKTREMQEKGQKYSVWKDHAYILLVTVLVLFAGLRTSYNDTGNYIREFSTAPGLSEFLADSKNYNLFKNPLFYLYQSFLKTFANDSQVLIFTTSLFTQISFVRFIKRYSSNFTFSIFLYFALGTYVFTLAAIKQVVAMAILMMAVPYLEKKKWVRYYALVIIAMLFHTYALVFAVLPLFFRRPWKAFTFIFVAVVAVIMMNFEETITAFMEQANDLGKTLANYEIFDNHSVNTFRLMVYAVTPLISLIFQKWVFHKSTQTENMLVHMSIISLAFMSMGTETGANMFGRMATYFELGTICCLPWMLRKIFNHFSYRLVSIVAIVCFLGYFAYAYGVSMNFNQEYSAVGLLDFLFR